VLVLDLEKTGLEGPVFSGKYFVMFFILRPQAI